MNNRIECQLVNILLNKDNVFVNKYTSIMSSCFNYETLLDNYFKDKNMRTIKVDKDTQSICFTNQNDLINIYNSSTKKNEEYYEEIHIHCNDLGMFNNFINYLKDSEYRKSYSEDGNIPHAKSISIEELKNSELVMEPMTNEVETTKSLLNTLSKNSDETIFRAIAIHFAKLVDKTNEIDFELIDKLNNIYRQDVVSSDYSFFSNNISNKFLNLYNDEKSFETKVTDYPSKNFNENIYELEGGIEYE